MNHFFPEELHKITFAYNSIHILFIIHVGLVNLTVFVFYRCSGVHFNVHMQEVANLASLFFGLLPVDFSDVAFLLCESR